MKENKTDGEDIANQIILKHTNKSEMDGTLRVDAFGWRAPVARAITRTTDSEVSPTSINLIG